MATAFSDYDRWKLASPHDYEDEPEDECLHEEYETDILTGRASCTMCDHVWYLTSEQIERYAKLARMHDEAMRCFDCRPSPAFREVAFQIDDDVPF